MVREILSSGKTERVPPNSVGGGERSLCQVSLSLVTVTGEKILEKSNFKAEIYFG